MNDDEPKPSTIWIGGLVGLAPALLTFIAQSTARTSRLTPYDTPLIPTAFLASISIWPLAAIIMLFSPSSRRFGLGMLLGVGVGWLVMLCICGGMSSH